MYNLAINCGEAIGPTFGGIITNMYKFESACKGTSLLNVSYALIYALINFNIIKKHFNNSVDIPEKEAKLDQEYADIRYTELDVAKDRIKDIICYTTKNRGYSFSSWKSKTNSICITVQ